MRETVIEYRLVNRSNLHLGGLCYKWKSTRRGVPDRILLAPIPEEHREIVARYVRFVETKSPDGSVSSQQRYVHGLIRDLGFVVEVPHTPDMVDAIITGMQP